MKALDKKGQVLENLGILGVSVAVFTIIIVVAFLMMSQIRDQAADQGKVTIDYANASIAFINNTAFSLGGSCMGMSSCLLWNDTANTVAVPTAQYNCAMSGETQPQITISNVSGFRLTTPVYLNWTCITRSSAYNSTVELTEATSTIPGWIPLVIIVIIGMLILGMISRFRQ